MNSNSHCIACCVKSPMYLATTGNASRVSLACLSTVCLQAQKDAAKAERLEEDLQRSQAEIAALQTR